MKLFRLEEANELIPTVRPIVTAIARHYAAVNARRAEAAVAAEAAPAGGGGLTGGGHEFCQSLLGLVERTTELDALGVQLKDYARGLIDFPSLRDGRVILLCWLLGEGDRIAWWHEMDAGFAGRQPI